MRATRTSIAPLMVVLTTLFSQHSNLSVRAFSYHVLPTTMARSGRVTSSTQKREKMIPSSCLFVQNHKSISEYHVRRRDGELSASSVSDFSLENGVSIQSNFFEAFLLPVISASLMITGNTVGAGMLVLPELMAGPGPLLSFGVMFLAWLMNLTSGLAIAQVAIQQKETSGSDIPSSFQEFAEATLPSAASAVSGISIAINTLILAFDVFKAGQIGSYFLPISGGDGELLSYLWGAALTLLVSTQSLGTLSQVASVLVMALFATFASLLLPGLANVADMGTVLTAAPALPSEQLADGLLQMVPVVITTLVFQNIVPTVTRLLDYDRTKVTAALTIGSIIPLFMYMAWSLSILGGGIDASSSLAISGLISCFGLITVAGSSLGTSMSLSEEFEIILRKRDEACEEETTQQPKKDTFSFASVAAPIGISLLVGQVYSSDITDLLKLAGSFGSPMLYGAIPVAMALAQQQHQQGPMDSSWFDGKMNGFGGKSVVPGGVFGLGALGLGSTCLIGTELLETMVGHGASMI